MPRTPRPSQNVVIRHRAASNRFARGGRGDAGLGRNIYSQLAARLGHDIIAGVYPPGDLLPNAVDMCRRFAVSRTALREAYSILNAKALIVARPKIGTRVRPQAEWNLLDPEVLAWHLRAAPHESLVDDLFVLRQMVEPAAAAFAASSASRANVQSIGEAYDRMDRYKNGAGDLIGADLDF